MTEKAKKVSSKEKNGVLLEGMINDYNAIEGDAIIARGIHTKRGQEGCLLLVSIELGNAILNHLCGEPKNKENSNGDKEGEINPPEKPEDKKS